MKYILLACVSVIFGGGIVLAVDDVQLLVNRKDLETAKTSEANSSTEKTTTVYKVKVSSRTSKELQNVVINYNIFYEDAKFGSTEKPELKTLSGKFEIAALLMNKPVEFDTETILLEENKLFRGFPNGAPAHAQDKVVGIWFKIFDAVGNQIGEYKNPSTVVNQPWKDL